MWFKVWLDRTTFFYGQKSLKPNHTNGSLVIAWRTLNSPIDSSHPFGVKGGSHAFKICLQTSVFHPKETLGRNVEMIFFFYQGDAYPVPPQITLAPDLRNLQATSSFVEALVFISAYLNRSQTYWRSVSQLTHRLRQATEDSGQRFSLRFFTTHNLLVKNEVKKSQRSKLGEKDCDTNYPLESREVFDCSSLNQKFQKFHIPSKKTLRQRAFQGGVIGRKILVRGCVTPPWNDLKLSDISFINPLRFAPIANATTGWIQAMMLHSDKSLVGGDSV